MKTVEQIDAELGRVQKAIASLEADKVKNIALLETAKGAREQNALLALAGSDAKAQDALKKARAAQRELEFLIEDLASATGEAYRQLENLKAERAEAFRAERWQEFQQTAATAQGQADLIDGALSSLAALLQEHGALLTSMTALAEKAGRPKVFSIAHARRVMEAKLWRILPGEFHAPSEGYRNARYSEILAQLIDGAGNTAEVTETQKAS